MDNGKLTDHHGKTVDFRNVILIMTTNAGASDMAREGIGFGNDHPRGARTRKRSSGCSRRNSATASMRSCRSAICRPRSSPASSTSSSSSSSSSSPTATSISSSTTRPRAWLTERGYDKLYGARPMGRLVQEKIKQPLAEELLFGKLDPWRRGQGPDQGQCARLRDHPRPAQGRRRARRRPSRQGRRPARRAGLKGRSAAKSGQRPGSRCGLPLSRERRYGCGAPTPREPRHVRASPSTPTRCRAAGSSAGCWRRSAQPYETVLLDYGTTMKAPDYLAVNPMGKVPAIRHGDTVVTEAAAICAYLADAFPGRGPGAAAGQPQARRLIIAGCSSPPARSRRR